jgi:transglutaminase-like putative cysteine protease
MHRRGFLQTAAIGLASRMAARESWRTFEITTHVEVLKPAGPTRIWLPAALLGSTAYQRTLSNTYRCDGGTAKLPTFKNDSMAMIAAEFPADMRPVLTATSRVATRDRTADLTAPKRAAQPSASELQHWLRPTRLLPTDGMVKETALQITRGADGDLAKARAIYEWIVENTRRDPATRGCGRGDIRFMLESRDLAGKCADLNALYVGLARAAGLPARDVYGIRVAPSELGYKSLGAASQIVTKAQHCRAEVYLSGFGWVPVDPADVRKVMLEEPPGNRPLADDMVKKARARLFGSWEMNWIAYNFAHDVALPGSGRPPLGFLMYPQAETADGLLDCLNPDSFRYQITAKEIG